MNDQMFRDLVSLILIGAVVVITSTGHVVDPQVKEWADVAFGFLFGFKTAGYVIGKQDSGAEKAKSALISPIEETKP